MSSEQQLEPARRRFPIRPAWLPALVLVLSALVLSPVLFAGFIRLDDYSHLFDNPQLRRMSLAGVATFWTGPYFNLYIPITYSVWCAAAMLGNLFGPLRETAWLFHALNLAVHVANAGLVFSLLRTLIATSRGEGAAKDAASDAWVAFPAALLFALHPVQVETVAWVSELKGGLAMLFGLLGLVFHVRKRAAVLTAACFVAAMLSKPVAIVFPVIVWLIQRMAFGMSLRKSVTRPAIYAALLLPWVLVTKHLQPDANLDFVPTLPQRFVVAADAFTFYLSKVLFPFPLAVDYGRSPEFVLGHMQGWRIVPAALILLVAVALIARFLFRPRPGTATASLTCGLAIFFAGVVPVLGLVPFGFQQFSTVADHYLYIPLVGVALMVTGARTHFRTNLGSRIAAAAVLSLFAVSSFRQARLWHSNESLFENTVKVNPQSTLGYHSMAEEALMAGRFEDTIALETKALAVRPDYLKAEIARGLARLQSGDPMGAIADYEAVLGKNPSTVGGRARDVASIHNNLGSALLRVGRIEDALDHFRKAVALFPRSLNAHLNLGNVAFDEGRYADAITEYEIARTITPGNPAVEQRLERARQSAGRSPGPGDQP